MNNQQLIDLLKGLTIAGGPVALLIGVFVGGDTQRANEVSAAIGSLVTIAGVIWTVWDARKAATVTKAASLEGVQVHVNTATADPTVVEVAQAAAKSATDPVADVVPMIGGPRQDNQKQP